MRKYSKTSDFIFTVVVAIIVMSILLGMWGAIPAMIALKSVITSILVGFMYAIIFE